MGTFLIGLLVGSVSGLLLMAIVSGNKVTELEESLKTQILLRKNRDKFIEKSMKTNLELKNKIVDLENNIEFLFNNLSEQKKKLVIDGKSKN